MDFDSFALEFFNEENAYNLFSDASFGFLPPFFETSPFSDNIIEDEASVPQTVMVKKPHKRSSRAKDCAAAKSRIDISKVMINPTEIGFQPLKIWENYEMSLKDILITHFRRRSSRLVKFPHKLFNALIITSIYPELYSTMGVMWISDTLIKVNKEALGVAFGVKRPKASFFNPQGAFRTHGFKEVPRDIVHTRFIAQEYLSDIDGSNVRVYEHAQRMFTRDMDLNNLDKCKWKKTVTRRRNA